MNKQASRVISLLLMLSLLLSLPLSATETTTAPAESEPAVTTPSPPSQTDPETSLPPMTKVEAGGVINGRSGEMLYSLNESRKMPPAAAVKLMTALLVIEHFGQETDTVIEITADALAGGSGVGANL